MDPSPENLNANIDTTPAWTSVVEALNNFAAGARVVINSIRNNETDKLAVNRIDFPAKLWMEREIKLVANVTRRDVQEFLALAAEM